MTYARGTASEDRWTGGGRLTTRMVGFDVIAEAAHQWGKFGTATIDATGAFADVGRRLQLIDLVGVAFTPKIAFRMHYASGDSNLKDTTLRNFVAAYLAASIISEMSLISVSNAVNLQPYLQFFIASDLTLGANWNFVRKATLANSVYGPTNTLITAKNSNAMNVAQIAQLDLTWDASRFLQIHVLYSHIYAGDYSKAAGGRDFDYYRLQLMARW